MATRSKVKVLGTTYYITTSGSEEQMRHIEEQLNDQLTGILEQRPSLSTLDAVVILCLNLMDQLTETESSTDRMREQLSQYLEDAAKARMELEDQRRQCDRLTQELADELAAQFTGMGLTASSEDVQGFVDAFMSMFKNVELTAKVKESNEKEGTSVVTCTISTFDANALNTAMSEALENIDPDAEFSTILSAIADVIADITPSGETADFDVDFELQKMEINGKEKEVWLPVDANEFGNLISTTAMGG